MKEFIITGIMIVLIVFLVTTYVLGTGTGTMQGQSTRIGNGVIDDMETVLP